MKISIVVEGANRIWNATLENSHASRDFAVMLPLSLTLSDYNGTEKIADLPARLSTDGTPDGISPEIGDITYYAPWGNLAIFYRGFPYSRGLVRLGRIEGDIKSLTDESDVRVRIERATNLEQFEQPFSSERPGLREILT